MRFLNCLSRCFFSLLNFFTINQQNLYGRFKRRYFTDDDSSGDKSSSLCVDDSDTIEISDKKECSISCVYEDKLDASVLKILPSKLQSIEQQQTQQQQMIVTEMGDAMENNHENGGDVVRKISTSEETEKDDKFPQQMANNNKSANWNTMELGEKRKRLR